MGTLIRSIPQICVDHVIVFEEAAIRRIVHSCIDYYNSARTHLSMEKDSPRRRGIQGRCVAKSIEYVERVIGSIRRECLDHVIVFSEAHLRRIMRQYVQYYNSARTRLSLEKDSSAGRPVHGLHHQYVRT